VVGSSCFSFFSLFFSSFFSLGRLSGSMPDFGSICKFHLCKHCLFSFQV